MRRTVAMLVAVVLIVAGVAISEAQLGRITPQVEITSDHVDGLQAAGEIREVLARYDVRLEVEIVYAAGEDARPRVRLVKLAHAAAE